jgi:hypothetical protein
VDARHDLGEVTPAGCMNEQHYLGLQNRSSMYGIHVGIEIVAIKKIEYLEVE